MHFLFSYYYKFANTRKISFIIKYLLVLVSLDGTRMATIKLQTEKFSPEHAEFNSPFTHDK